MYQALKRYQQLFTGLCIGVVLLSFGFLVTKYFQKAYCPFTLINPTRCEPGTAFVNPEYDALRQELNGYIAQQRSAGLEKAGVYFRDLRNGPTFSINAKDTYIGASILKMPVLLEYLKEAETQPEIFDVELVAEIVPTTTNQGLPVNQTVEGGKKYTVRTLLERMIKYSDNNSRAALVKFYQSRHPEGRIILDTLENIGISQLKTDDQGTYISVDATASIFRILYNAAYLGPEQSQLALTWLTASAYDDGIAKPIPQDIPVANKYGIYNTAQVKELHDCGIIFYPNHPYVLCVMTKGRSIENLQNTIVHISKVVYEELASRFPR